MCIAIYKPIGVEVPTEAILKNCFDSNKDGAGMAWNSNGHVHIKKGYMTFESFLEAFKFNNEHYNFKECGLLLHFRIHTHGANNASMTHPFPMSSDNGQLEKTDIVSDYAIVHNGIIHLTSTASYNASLSDTATFIRDYLTLIAKNPGWFTNDADKKLIETLIGASSNRMAILNSEGQILGMGSTWTEDNGIFYSNESFKDYYTRYGKTYNKGVVTGTAAGTSTSTSKYYGYNDDDYNYGRNYSWADKGKNVAGTGTGAAGTGAGTVGTKSSTSTTNTAKTIGLMRILTNETVNYDGFDQYIEKDIPESFWIDKSGAVYASDCDPAVPDKMMFLFIGTKGIVYDMNTNVKAYKADIFFCANQFPELVNAAK